MLDGIKDILKTMGKALTFANAGEMLTNNQKVEVLGRPKKPCSTASIHKLKHQPKRDPDHCRVA